MMDGRRMEQADAHTVSVTLEPAGATSGLPFRDRPLLIGVEAGRLLLFFRDDHGVRRLVGEAGEGEFLLLPAGAGNDDGSWLIEPVSLVRARVRAVDPAIPVEAGSVLAQELARLVRVAGVVEQEACGKPVGLVLETVRRSLEERNRSEDAAAPVRFADSATTREELLHRSLGRLAAVAGAQLPAVEEAEQDCEDDDLAALALAMRIEGVPLSPSERARISLALLDVAADAARPGAEERSEDAADAVGEDRFEQVMRLANLRYRRVALEDGWWRDDHGTLLARDADGEALVLEPIGGRRRTGYRCWRPGMGGGDDFDPESVTISGRWAFQPCARLPGRPIGLGALLRHGLWRIGGEAWRFAALLAAAALLSLGTPLATGVIMSRAIPEGDGALLLVLFVALGAAALAGSMLDLVRSLLMVRIEGRAAWRLQTLIWDRLLRLPLSFFRNFDVGDLANRALSIDTIRAMAGAQVVEAVSHVFFGLFALGLMFWYSPLLGAVAGGVGLLFGGVVWWTARRVVRHVQRITDDTGRLEAMVFQFIQAIAKIRIAGATNAAFSRFADLYRGILSESRRQQLAQAVLVSLSGVWPVVIFAMLVLATALAGGGLFAVFWNPTDWAGIEGESLRGVVAPASFIAFYAALGLFSVALVGAGRACVFLATVRPWAERVAPLLAAKPETAELGGARRPAGFSGHLSVVGLAFRYDGDSPRVLDGIDFEVRPGEMVALVGPSGAGKSTVVRLLLGFERPEAGSIFYDDIDLSRLDPGWLRRRIGVVLQDGRLLPGSIFENVAAGARISRERALEAIRMAGMEEDLEEMPMGLETMLGEGAVTLSGGQRQRLMIARALVRRPKLVIFDEATSALDNETQAVVTESLSRLEASRLVIAHRLSTIRDADHIHVLDAGRIVQSGRFDELLKAEGPFRRLARRQMIAPDDR